MRERQWQSLEEGLRGLADETSRVGVSPEVEQRLRSALAARKPVRAPAWRWALAASLAAVGFLGALLVSRSRPEAARVTPVRSVVAGEESYTQWYVERGAPREIRGQVVRMRVSPAAAAAFGVPVVPVSAKQGVPADVFVGDDGVMRAIRFVR